MPYRYVMTVSFTVPTQPAPLRRLSTRIITSSVVALLVVLGMIGWTLWLSWQLEGSGGAINDAGSLRMRANLIAVELSAFKASPDTHPADRVLTQIQRQDDTLALLKRGNPSRPLFLPANKSIHAQMDQVMQLWHDLLKPAALNAIQGADDRDYLEQTPVFVKQADQLVSLIEKDNSGKTSLLRLSQGILIAMACVGTLAMIYLLYLWIIHPVLRLQHGLSRMAARDFSLRLPVDSQDEFGVLTAGFNSMADELQSLYDDLEARVNEKTAQLAAQNKELATLYDMAAFLNQPNDIEAMCQGFLDRIMKQFDAAGGSIRTLDPSAENLTLVVSRGLSPAHDDAEHCIKYDACFCGVAIHSGDIVIKNFDAIDTPVNFKCAQEGFRSLAAFRIQARDQVLGSFSLHFQQSRNLSAEERQLLETLGQHLGIALENRRLSAQARQLAMIQERALLAEGLHDSIAQSLNFLNLQLQLLDQAISKGNQQETREILPLLHAGVKETYQDVRELLGNFRSKLTKGDLLTAIEDTVARFRRQCSAEAILITEGLNNSPLAPEQQLQILFILQEALSNVRKHAQASKVEIRIDNGRDFRLEVTDNGVGFDVEAISQRSTESFGRRIMHERAQRINASLDIRSRPGQGTSLILWLPASERQAA